MNVLYIMCRTDGLEACLMILRSTDILLCVYGMRAYVTWTSLAFIFLKVGLKEGTEDPDTCT